MIKTDLLTLKVLGLSYRIKTTGLVLAWAFSLGSVDINVGAEEIGQDLTGPLKEVVDFGLIDHRGDSHRIYYFDGDKETKAIALFVHGNGCPLVRKRIPQLETMAETLSAEGIRLMLINSNFQDTRDEIAEEAREFSIDLPILIDDDQLVGEMLGLTRTAEIILIDTESWKMVFRGPIDDRLDYEKELPEARNHYFNDAVSAFLAGEEIPNPVISPVGCLISFPELEAHQKNELTYAGDIAPILKEKCVHCHTKGGIGPFAMSSHRKVRGWMDMIEEVVMNRRMPPWQADPHFGEFTNDFSLSNSERQKLVHWIRDGARRDEGEPDPLDGLVIEKPDWAMGQPNHVIPIPDQEVPAEGIIDYRYVHMDSPFGKDTWIRAVDIRPGNTKVLHHIIAYIREMKDGEYQRTGFIAGYAPGMGPSEFPENSGILLPKDAQIEFELHYTACGTPEIDSSRLGIYFHETPPAKKLHTGLLIDMDFQIPPHDGNFQWTETREIKKDITLYGMNPHMHLRGKAMKYSVRYPSGESEVLLSVPAYNFNWQRNYRLVKPARIPAGSSITVVAAWDNSSLNPSNPDPSLKIGWGEQSFDEMFFATYLFTYDDDDQNKGQGPFSLSR